jgi:arylsulfate sulfotransferase
MRRVKGIALAASALAFLAMAAAAAAIAGGLLVRPSRAALAKAVEVPAFDVLEWQSAREGLILADYARARRGLSDPLVVLDPYGMNPLCALALFETDEPARIRVEVRGDEAATAFSYAAGGEGRLHEVPILGLYAGRRNEVGLVATYEGGRSERASLTLATEALPLDFQAYEIVASRPELMEGGVTLLVACFESGYTCLLDARGEVRGYLSRRGMAHGTSIIALANGRLMGAGDEMRQVPYNMASLWEFNWLGKVFREYEIPNAVHHGVQELPSGDILAVSNSRDMFSSGTREDVAIVVDRETGAVKREYDFRRILDETRDPYTHFHPDILNAPNRDWMHMNAAIWDARDSSLIVSSPIQSMVVKIDAETSRVKWILGPHSGYEGSSAPLSGFLLEPAGPSLEWQWGQHYPAILGSSPGGALDLLLLDNGQSRSFTRDGALSPAGNYSRAVEYRIDEGRRTVAQVWQYGKERGAQCYAPFLGSASRLPATGGTLIAFGGQPRKGGAPTDDIVAGVLGEEAVESRIVEVARDGSVVFEAVARGNEYRSSAETYQAYRMPLFDAGGYGYRLGAAGGRRLGESYSCAEAADFKAPLLYAGGLSAEFRDLHREGGRLVVDGELSFGGKRYLLGKAVLVFRSRVAVKSYPANSGLNGRFFASVDLAAFPPGAYLLTVAGGARIGNDAAAGRTLAGSAATGYKVTLP